MPSGLGVWGAVQSGARAQCTSSSASRYSPIGRRLWEICLSGADGRLGPKALSQPLYVRTKLKLLTGEGASTVQAAWHHVVEGIWAAP